MGEIAWISDDASANLKNLFEETFRWLSEWKKTAKGNGAEVYAEQFHRDLSEYQQLRAMYESSARNSEKSAELETSYKKVARKAELEHSADNAQVIIEAVQQSRESMLKRYRQKVLGETRNADARAATTLPNSSLTGVEKSDIEAKRVSSVTLHVDDRSNYVITEAKQTKPL